MPTINYQGLIIKQPVEKLLVKFGFEEPSNFDPQFIQNPLRKFMPYQVYDGYVTPNEKSNNFNTIGMEDLLITSSMNSRIDSKTILFFYNDFITNQHRYQTAQKYLERLPINLSISDSDDDQINDIYCLYNVFFEIKYIKLAVASKVLCRKRPMLIPMIDRILLNYSITFNDYNGLNNNQDDVLSISISQLKNHCIALKDALNVICKSIYNLKHVYISPLRALESLIWFEITNVNTGVCELIDKVKKKQKIVI